MLALWAVLCTHTHTHAHTHTHHDGFVCTRAAYGRGPVFVCTQAAYGRGPVFAITQSKLTSISFIDGACNWCKSGNVCEFPCLVRVCFLCCSYLGTLLRRTASVFVCVCVCVCDVHTEPMIWRSRTTYQVSLGLCRPHPLTATLKEHGWLAACR